MKTFTIFCLVLSSIGVLSSPFDGNSSQWTLDQQNVEIDQQFNPLTDIVYHLFTRQNPTESQRITTNTIFASNWNSANDVRFLIHGHNSDVNSLFSTLIRNQLLANADHNVVVVDWSVGSNTRLYSTARNRVGTAGVAVANFIDDLSRVGVLDLSRTHIIGHNLGAHVAGNAGKNVMRGRIQAIFGLDPAGGSFSSSDTDRLAFTDAVYTEAIHTNAGGNGFAEPITTASFYPNWGASQPGCGVDVSGNCAHERSILLYAESISSNRFVARKCSGYQQITGRNCPGIGSGVMGGDVSKALNGVFYLATNSVSPFAQN
ncbi:lipase member I-like [Chironomus tepperi]|uniref:lipase member I-like n=1 Tax=Chironomus tepperi TaxID=113505 RepID=UPI00391EEA2C